MNRDRDECISKRLSEALTALQRAKDSLVAFKFMPASTIGHPWEDSDEANLATVNAALGWVEPNTEDAAEFAEIDAADKRFPLE